MVLILLLLGVVSVFIGGMAAREAMVKHSIGDGCVSGLAVLIGIYMLISMIGYTVQ